MQLSLAQSSGAAPYIAGEDRSASLHVAKIVIFALDGGAQDGTDGKTLYSRCKIFDLARKPAISSVTTRNNTIDNCALCGMAQHKRASVQAALQRVQLAIAEDDGSSAAKHKEATDAVAMLQRAVERPDETFGRQRFSILLPFVLRFAVEYGILQSLAAAGDQPKTAAELAEASGADELIIVRAMRLLTANGICDELERGKYSANAITQYAARTPIIGGFLHLYDHVTPIMAKTPELIQAHRLGSGAASHQSPFQEVYGAPMFGVLAKNPAEKKNFDNFMQARLHPSIPKWFDIYDAQSQLAAVDNLEGKALVVDVG